jgi:hypothetical protein
MATKTKRIDPPHPKAQKPADQGPNPTLDAMGLTAVAKFAKADTHSDLLTPGFYTVDLEVDGHIDGKRWTKDIVGTLTVGMDSAPVATSSTPWAELLQSALASFSAKERQLWLQTVAMGAIPGIDCGPEKAAAIKAEMEPALKAYRATKTAPKRGNVAFVPTIPPKA